MSRREGKEAALSEEEHEKDMTPDMKLFYKAFIGEFRRFNKRIDELNDKLNEVFITATNNPRRDGSQTRDIKPSGSEDDEVSNYSMRRRPRREEPRARKHEHDEKKVTLAPLSPNEVYLEQLKLSKGSHGDLGSEANKRIECKEAKSENNKNKGPMVSDCTSKNNKEESAIEKSEKSEKKKSFNAKEREVKSAFLGKKAILLVRFREVLLCETNLNPDLPSVFVSLLQDFDEKSKLRGVPRTIKYDMDVEFLSPFWKVLWDDTWRIFKPGDWVWVYLRKKRFPNLRKSKLDARGDGPFQVFERVNDNEYKIALQGEYNVSATFNVSAISPFDMDADSRTNLFEEGGNDAGIIEPYSSIGVEEDDIILPSVSVMRSRAKKIKAGMLGLVKRIMGEDRFKFPNDLNTFPRLNDDLSMMSKQRMKLVMMLGSCRDETTSF